MDNRNKGSLRKLKNLHQSQNQSSSQPPHNGGQPVQIDPMQIRKAWKEGSKVEVFSSSAQIWYEGDIVRIFSDDEGEWIEAQYTVNSSMRLKQIPRFDENNIRPILVEYSSTQNSHSDTNSQFKQKSRIYNGNILTKHNSNANNNSGHGHQSSTAPIAKLNVDDMSQEAIDEQIRHSWVRGSRVEVYSRGRKDWCRGLVTRVFVDEEGEWLEVRYGRNLVKETPRESPDIRPLRVRYKNRFKWTKEHEAKVTSIWEDVDLEHTRHLDVLLVAAVFRALNIDKSVLNNTDLDEVFTWIDREEREAVTVEEFIRWMTDSVDTIKQRQIQQKMFDAIHATVTGKLDLSNSLKEEEKRKLKQIYQQRFNKSIKLTQHSTLSSRFNPTISSPIANPESIDRSSNVALSMAMFGHSGGQHVTNAGSNVRDTDDEKVSSSVALFQPPLQGTHSNESNNNNNNSNNGGQIMDDVEIEMEPMDMDDDEMAEFSEEDDENDDEDEKIPLNSNESHFIHQQVMTELTNKLKNAGFDPEYLVASVEAQQEEYHSELTHSELRVRNNNLLKSLHDIQEYMTVRVRKSGVEGLRIQELQHSVLKKFTDFKQSNFLPSTKATFGDFVSLCPGLVVVEMESGSGNKQMEQIAVTNNAALKINLKTKLQFVLMMLFDKGKITNNLQPIMLNKDKYGRIKGRRLSVGERLITVGDFVGRIRSLGVELDTLEGDELFWAVAGSNSTMISQKMVARYFSQLVEHLPDPVNPEVADALPRVIDMARLRYRREPLWSKYIIRRTISRWNNIAYLRLTDRRTRSKSFDMIVTPKTRSVHGGELLHVQKSFHYTCHILNKLQYPTVAKKVDHGSDKFNFCCVTRTPHLRSFPAMLDEAKQREIPYSEHFIAQVVGIACETVIFCHKHDTVNITLNVDTLGFDTQLRPILLDFSRAIVLGPEQKTSRFSSVMSSTPPELALLMGSDNPLMNIELNGSVLRKADAWRVGVLLYTLVTGRLPFHSTSLGNFITHVLTRPPVIPIDQIQCSQALKNLLHRLLETTYFNRLEIGDALRDAWFKNACKDALSPTIIENIRNVCKLENARNWISTITHAGEDFDTKRVDRDRKYFARLDPTGQRKALKREALEQFMQDRMGYCYYRSKQIVRTFIALMHVQQSQMSEADHDQRAYTWAQFEAVYAERKWGVEEKTNALFNVNMNNHTNVVFNPYAHNNKASNNNSKQESTEEESNSVESNTRRFTNAIFAGLDPEGLGRVSCKLLMALFEDINLKLSHVVDRLSFQPQMSFEECVAELTTAFQSGFDIKDLLSVDHVVNSM